MRFFTKILAIFQKQDLPGQNEIDSIRVLAKSKLDEVRYSLGDAKRSFDPHTRKQQILAAKQKLEEIDELATQHDFLRLNELYALKARIISLERENPRKLELRALSQRIGSSEQACPYCSIHLAKMPLRKTKCKSCSKFIYPRKEPLSGDKRLLKEEELALYEELKALSENSWESWQQNQERLIKATENTEKIRQQLANEWGVPTSSVTDGDVEWRFTNDGLSQALKERDWPTYLSLREESIRQLLREDKLKQALNLLPESIYLTYAAPDVLEMSGLAEYSLVNFDKKTHSPVMSLYLNIENDIQIIKQVYDAYTRGNNLSKTFDLSADDAWAKFEKDYNEHMSQ